MAKPLRCRVLYTTETQMDSPDILRKQPLVHVATKRERESEREKRRKRNDRENMREREKQRKTGSSIFSEAQHPAAQTSSSFQKKDGVFVKYTSFSTQENVALIDGRCAVQ